MEICIENNTTLKWDEKKSLFLVQLNTNPYEVFFNLKLNNTTKSKKVEEIKSNANEDDNEGGEQSSQLSRERNKTTCQNFLPKSILCMGNNVSEVTKAMCCFRGKNELLSFLVYPKDENPVNFTQLNLFFFVCFTLDIILCSVVPLFFHANTCGKGMLWGAHYFMGSYFTFMLVVEYIYVQYLYSKICQPCNFSRFYYPIKPCFFSMLAKLDIYTDICMTVEIFKCQDEPDSKSYFIFLFVFSFIVFCISVLYQVWSFIKMLIGKQPRSTFNPLYSNTSCLAYSASFKCLGEFVDRFCIQYYGRVFDRFNAKQELALAKLIVEDLIQCLIQFLFLLRRSSSEGAYLQIVISLFLSGFSAMTSIAVIFADTTSPLSIEDLEYLGNFFILRFILTVYIGKDINYQTPDNSNALEALDCVQFV